MSMRKIAAVLGLYIMAMVLIVQWIRFVASSTSDSKKEVWYRQKPRPSWVSNESLIGKYRAVQACVDQDGRICIIEDGQLTLLTQPYPSLKR